MSYIKTKYINIRSYRKQTAPKYIEGQEVRERSGRFYRKLCSLESDVVIVMDDECYIHADPSYASGVQFNHTSKEKFPKTFLVWQAVSSDGL